MNELTGQDVVSAIAIKLRNRFSKTEIAEIYKNKPMQSMVTPCAFIHLIEDTHTPDLANYAWWDRTLDIRFHPSKSCTNINTWAQTLRPMIIECLEYITIDGQEVKSRNIVCKVEDNVLHVVLNYKYRVMRKLEDVPDMETLIYGQAIKQTIVLSNK